MKKHSADNCTCSLEACAMEVRDLGVTLNRNVILDDISFDVRCGEITALIGPNGAGKSTLLKAIMGMIPHTGCVHFCRQEHHGGGAPRIGYVPQHLNFDRETPMTVLELFAMAYSRRPAFLGVKTAVRERAKRSLERVEAAQLLHKRVGKLSGGEMQRALFALATDPMPHILFMDEPLAGIDVTGEALIYDLIEKMRGNMEISVVIVSHDLSMVTRRTDHVVCINRRLICEGGPSAVLTPERIKETFGDYVAIYQHRDSHPQE